jgi:hypothetical protein
MWNCELSTCFSALLSFFEIALRNKVHYSMSQFYCKDNWYDDVSLKLKKSTLDKIDDIRYVGYGKKRKLRYPAPSSDEIVSRVSFGFWPGVLGSIDLRYAHKILPNIFPYHILNVNSLDWNIPPNKNRELEFIYELNSFRNRIAHHEPLWKFAAIKDTSGINPVIIVPSSNNLSDSLNRFTRLLSFIDKSMAAMDQNFHTDLIQSSWRRKLNYLLSDRGVVRYKTLKHCPAYHSLTPAEFRRKFKLIVKENKPVRVGNSNIKGLFIPE